ncbi:MAG TPA: glutamine amidotransferase [Actinomycetota bacterium]|nr:glutamine amidotransferase [Actinomycetota bacterium]
MCGQCGLILPEPGPVGELLTEMEAAMIHRGPDSTGFALYGEEPRDDRIVVRARIAEASRAEESLRQVVDGVRRLGAELRGEPQVDDDPAATDRFVRLVVAGAPPEALLEAIEAVEGVVVHSMGRRLEIVKDVGDARAVAARHGVRGFVGTHGLAHSRLATESIVNVEWSHPFWARPFLDVAIAHNGQLTNHHRLRRLMVQRGLRFLTDNDSEVIAVYIAEQLSRGVELEEALRRSIDALDGVFTYLLSTADGIGMASDRLAIKPLVVTETAGRIAMATEEQALRHIFPEEIATYVPREGTAVVWPARPTERRAA